LKSGEGSRPVETAQEQEQKEECSPGAIPIFSAAIAIMYYVIR